MVSNGARPGWLAANEMWSAGCQSCVSTTLAKRGAMRLMTGTMASPSATAKPPPGMKPYWASMMINAVASSSLFMVSTIKKALSS